MINKMLRNQRASPGVHCTGRDGETGMTDRQSGQPAATTVPVYNLVKKNTSLHLDNKPSS